MRRLNGPTEVTVPTVFEGEVRLRRIAFSGQEPAIWLHHYDDPDEASHNPNEDDNDFFHGIAMTADAALLLSRYLQAAAAFLQNDMHPVSTEETR